MKKIKLGHKSIQKIRKAGKRLQMIAMIVGGLGIVGCFIIGIVQAFKDVAAILIIVNGGIAFYVVSWLLFSWGCLLECKGDQAEDIEIIREYIEE